MSRMRPPMRGMRLRNMYQPLLPMSWRRRTENSQGLCSLLFLNGGVDGIDDFFPWNQDFADVFFHLGNEVGLRGAA